MFSLFSTYFPTNGMNSIISSSEGFTPSSFLNSTNGKGKCMMHWLYKANPHKTPNWKYLWSSFVACWWESKSISLQHCWIWAISKYSTGKFWELNWVLFRCYTLSLKGKPVNRTVWGVEGLHWRETRPVFQHHWRWTFQIQVTPSRKTLHKKSLSCRQCQIHCFYQNKPSRQESKNWVKKNNYN